MSLSKIAALSSAALAAVLTFTVLADDAPAFQVDPAISSLSAQQKVAAREQAMKDDGKLLEAVAKAGANANAITSIDKVLQNFTNFPAWFSPDTKDTKSFAEPVVWQQFDQFTAIFDQGKTALLTLRTAAASGDAAGFKSAIGAVAKVCGDCHQTYRGAL